MGGCCSAGGGKMSEEVFKYPGHAASHEAFTPKAPPASSITPLISRPTLGSAPDLSSLGLSEYSLQELREATGNFRDEHLLGEGGFGKVHWGEVRLRGEKIAVAVKRLRFGEDTNQGEKEWLKELHTLGGLDHRNLVKLLGYCAERSGGKEERLLMYEFVANGSLDYHLFPESPEVAPLQWQFRLRVAVHVAKGLAYLHHCSPPFIHRDLKASNVLLAQVADCRVGGADGGVGIPFEWQDFTAKVTDFGLAKVGPGEDRSHVTTEVMGTMGYACPAYVQTGKLSVQSDVYSFGVVLLELITGRRAMSQLPNGANLRLTTWARPYLLGEKAGGLSAIMDATMPTPFPERVASVLTVVLRHCLNNNPKERPDMQHTATRLANLLRSEAWGGEEDET